MRHMQQYAATPQAIFIAFDASNIVSAEDREQRNTLIILFAPATVLLASVLSFFWYRRYLRSRQLLQDEMKRKEKLVALGHLAAGVAHEIRNPLSSIKGLAKYFAERAPAGGEAHQLAQVMAKEADRLNRVVSELLELVKPTHLALQAVDLNTLINHSLQLVSRGCKQPGDPVTLYRQRHITGNSGRSGQADSGPVESLSQCYSGDWSAWRD